MERVRRFIVFELDTSLYTLLKSRLDLQFVKKIPLEMVIVQQMKKEGKDQNYQWLLHLLSIHLLFR